MQVVIFPLAFVGVHLLLAYWLCKNAPLRYALPVLLGLTALISLAWIWLTFALLFGYSEAYLGLDYRPLDSLRSVTVYMRTLVLPLDPCGGSPDIRRLLGSANCGYVELWPLPLMLLIIGLAGFGLTRWGMKVVLASLFLLSAATLAYSLQPVRLADAVPEVQGVSLYPDAQQVMVTADTSLQWRMVTFVSHDSPQDVLTFYQTSLAVGWQRDEQHKAGADLLFVRPSSDGAVPRNRVVTVLAAPAGAGANVVLGIDQWVNVKRLPLFPKAQDPVVSEVVDANGELTRVTTFRTAASPDEVIAYYEHLRDQAGYMGLQRETISDGVQARLTAVAGSGTGRRIIRTPNVEIVITAKPQPDGPTTVTLHARGPDLP
jgi:hypothetical protein